MEPETRILGQRKASLPHRYRRGSGIMFEHLDQPGRAADLRQPARAELLAERTLKIRFSILEKPHMDQDVAPPSSDKNFMLLSGEICSGCSFMNFLALSQSVGIVAAYS